MKFALRLGFVLSGSMISLGILDATIGRARPMLWLLAITLVVLAIISILSITTSAPRGYAIGVALVAAVVAVVQVPVPILGFTWLGFLTLVAIPWLVDPSEPDELGRTVRP